MITLVSIELRKDQSDDFVQMSIGLGLVVAALSFKLLLLILLWSFDMAKILTGTEDTVSDFDSLSNYDSDWQRCCDGVGIAIEDCCLGCCCCICCIDNLDC
jgi:hypothetical protein